MKKNILLTSLLMFLLIEVIVAQDTLSLEAKPTFHATADLQDMDTNPGDVVAHAVVIIDNNSSGIKTYVWERIVNELPDGWTSGVCDTNQCYLNFVNTREFELGPGDEGRMDVHAYPGGNPGVLPGTAGEATVHLRVWEKDNPDNFEIGIYTFCISDGPNSPVNCSTTSTSNLEAQKIQVFPNPTNDFFKLSDNTLVEYLQVYNMVGKRVASYRESSGARHNITGLSNGIYMLQMQNSKGVVLKTVKLIKN